MTDSTSEGAEAPVPAVQEKAPPEWKRRLRKIGDAAATVSRHAPLSGVLAATLLVIGVVTATLWAPLRDATLIEQVGYGVPAFSEGRWWTIAIGMFFGLTPWHLIVMIVMLLTVVAWSEWRIGTRNVAWILVVGQVVGILGASAFAWLFGQLWASNWQWPQHLVEFRDVGMTTGILAVVAATTATVHSPWRLRSRLILAGYTVITFLFEGTFANVMHLFAFIAAVYIGERFFRSGERGYTPRTRREMRQLAYGGLLFIATTHILVWLFPGSGPLGPTDSGDEAVWAILLPVIVAVVIAHALRVGKRWAWRVSLGIALLHALAAVVVIVLVVTADYSPVGAVSLGISFLWIVHAGLLISGRYAFTVPWRVKKNSSDEPETVDRVKDLIRKHGGDTMSWMTTWTGNRYAFFTTDGRESVVAYHQHAGTMVALADPICADSDRGAVVQSFIDFAEQSGATPCWFSVGRQTADAVRGRGWRATQIAEDTIIDLPGLEFKGKSWQHLRSAMNKAKREGISFRLGRLAEEPFAVLSQVRSISEEWVGDKGLPEMGFTLGTTEEALDPEVRTALAFDEAGNLHGVLSWLPVYGGDGRIKGWTLDVMRRRSDGFGPVIEYLIGSSAMAFKDEGADFASLSGAPLTRSDAGADLEQIDRVLDQLGKAIEPYYGFRSLHNFKKKFNPRYEPVYIAYRDEGDLPRVGVAIGRSYLPNATPSQMIRMMKNTS